MKRTLFFGLCFLGSLAQPAMAVEIYVDGHKYNSIQAYQDAKERAALVPVVNAATDTDTDQKKYIEDQAQKMGVQVDFSKMKTFEINKPHQVLPVPPKMPAQMPPKISRIGVEGGMSRALKDFYLAQGRPQYDLVHAISSDQLQAAIKKAVSTSKTPKLIISEPGKVRILSINAAGQAHN